MQNKYVMREYCHFLWWILVNIKPHSSELMVNISLRAKHGGRYCLAIPLNVGMIFTNIHHKKWQYSLITSSNFHLKHILKDWSVENVTKVYSQNLLFFFFFDSTPIYLFRNNFRFFLSAFYMNIDVAHEIIKELKRNSPL